MAEPREFFVDMRTSVPGNDQARQAHLEAHRAYLGRLKEQGKLLMAGPLTDGSGGLVVFNEVASQQEAAALSSNDPFVRHGVHKSNIKTWRVVFR